MPEVLAQFPDARRSGDGWKARCPAHDDRVASLSISQSEKGWLLTCPARCAPKVIVDKVGLSMADLFYEKRRLVGAQDRLEANGGTN